MARENEHGPASERAARLQRRLQAAEATANGASGTANGATTWQKDVANYATPPRAAASSSKTSTAAVQQHATSPNQGRSTGMAELAGVDPPQGMAESAEAIPPQQPSDFTDVPLPPNAPAWPAHGEHITGALVCTAEGDSTRSRPVTGS